MVKSNYSVVDKAYAAAMLDGEGWMYANLITRKDTGWSNPAFKIGIANKSLSMLEWLKDSFGGKIYNQTSNGVYAWNLTKISEMLWFLKNVRPYMKIKCKVADIMIDVLSKRVDGIVNGHYTNRMTNQERNLILKIKELNETQSYLI